MTPCPRLFRTAAVSLSVALTATTAWADAIVIPIADRFDVIADGAPATLDILANDIDYDPAAPPPTRVSAPPACGSVDILENARARISIPPDCPDAITFDYCVDTEIGCLDAVVTLTVISRPEAVVEAQAVEDAALAVEVDTPVDVVEDAAPVVVEAAEPATPVDVVEETAPVVEAAAPIDVVEDTALVVEPATPVGVVEDTAPVVETAEPATPVDIVEETAPVVEATAPVDVVEDTAPMVEAAAPAAPIDVVEDTAPVVEAATPVDVVEDTAPVVEPATPVDVVEDAAPVVETAEPATPVDVVEDTAPVVETAEPAAPVDVVEDAASTMESAEPAISVDAPPAAGVAEPATPIIIDPTLKAQIAAALAEDDLVGCDVLATVVARPGGFNRLEAHSPCRMGEPILVSFDGLRYTARLDADGRGAIELFSLTPQAEAVIFTADGAQTTVDVVAVGLRGRDRVIIAWESFWNAQLDLIIPGLPPQTTETAAAESVMGGQLKVVFDMPGDAPETLTVALRDSVCGGERVTYRLLRSVNGEVRQDLRRIAVAANCPDAVVVQLAAR